MKNTLLIILAFALLLSGCSLGRSVEVQTDPPAAAQAAEAAPVLALEREELSSFEALFSVMLQTDGEMEINPLNCFLTSYYDSVKEIDMQAFLRYFPGARNGSEAEFEALRALPGWPFAQLAGIEDMPVPLSRYDAEKVRQVLKDWAGLSLEDVDISPESRVYYIEKYDAFYNYTSDFGLEQPEFYRGERQGDIVRLYWQHWYDGERMLTLKETEDACLVLSFQSIAEKAQEP